MLAAVLGILFAYLQLSFFACSGKVSLRSASMDCKQRSSTVSERNSIRKSKSLVDSLPIFRCPPLRCPSEGSGILDGQYRPSKIASVQRTRPTRARKPFRRFPRGNECLHSMSTNRAISNRKRTQGLLAQISVLGGGDMTANERW